jgi:hypothetical protein
MQPLFNKYATDLGPRMYYSPTSADQQAQQERFLGRLGGSLAILVAVAYVISYYS